MTDFEYYNAAEHALANYLGTDPDQDMVEMVGDCIYQAVQALPNQAHFNGILEKSSTYVQADMGLDELENYVSELLDQIDAYELL
jgi:hypothetical protein